MKRSDKNSLLSRTIVSDIKGKVSIVLYAIAIVSSVFNEWVACGIYALVAFIWIIPDMRIERLFDETSNQ